MVDLNQTPTSQFPKERILGIIDNAKKLDKRQSFDALTQIAKNYGKDEYQTKPGKFSLRISDTGEKAYQRAIFSSGITKLHTIGEVVWNDLELPVVFNRNSRRVSIDLIGTLNNNTPILCELKFASKQEGPVYAAIELLIYYYLIQDNFEELDKKKVFHENGIRFQWKAINDNTILVVGANKGYWNEWKTHYDERRIDIESWRNSLPQKVRYFSFYDFDFKGQKGTYVKYTPSVFDKIQWTEEFSEATQGLINSET